VTTPESRHWTLDPQVDFLNHGSFGACPRSVLAVQQELRERLERRPVQFMVRELEPRLDASRTALGAFVGADPAGLAFVTNATSGVNTVLRSLRLAPGDELVVTDHAYQACRNALDRIATRAGARVAVARVPFPLDSPDRVVDAVLGCVTPRTRLALLEHVTSPTGLVCPLEEMVHELGRRGVDVLVDGAHAPGMVPVDLARLGAAYYTANCHKWICAPKGAAFLWVREDRRADLEPLVTSHGATARRTDRSRFHLEFDWVGTLDPTPYLCVPAAIDAVGGMVPGGWPEVRTRNRSLALEARRILCEALDVAPPAPDSMIGSLVAVPLPPGESRSDPPSRSDVISAWTDPLQQPLVERYGIEVPVFSWPSHPARLVRVSAQLYNEPAQYERLARALVELLGR
jgi:isopenicillin-N epimerase